MPTPKAEHFSAHMDLEGLTLPQTLDYYHIDNRHNNARPPKPHIVRSGPLPPAIMDKIREEITKLFRDKLVICPVWVRHIENHMIIDLTPYRTLPSRD